MPKTPNRRKTNRVTRSRCACGRFKRRKAFVVAVTNDTVVTSKIPLHHLQIPGGMGLTVSSSNPSMERPSGTMELASKRLTAVCRCRTIRRPLRGERRRPHLRNQPVQPQPARQYQALRPVPLFKLLFLFQQEAYVPAEIRHSNPIDTAIWFSAVGYRECREKINQKKSADIAG